MKYNAALRSARMQEVIDAIDDGATEGTLEIGTGPSPAIGTVLVEIELQDPSFTESGGVITMAMPAGGLSGQATDPGTAAVAQIKDGDGTVVVSELTVGGPSSGAQITLNSTAISAGQTVTLSSGTITHSNNT